MVTAGAAAPRLGAVWGAAWPQSAGGLRAGCSDSSLPGNHRRGAPARPTPTGPHHNHSLFLWKSRKSLFSWPNPKDQRVRGCNHPLATPPPVLPLPPGGSQEPRPRAAPGRPSSRLLWKRMVHGRWVKWLKPLIRCVRPTARPCRPDAHSCFLVRASVPLGGGGHRPAAAPQ